MLGRFRQAFEGNMDKTRSCISSRTEAFCIWTQNAQKRGEKFPNMYTSIPAQTSVIWRRSIRQEKVSINHDSQKLFLEAAVCILLMQKKYLTLFWFNIPRYYTTRLIQ